MLKQVGDEYLREIASGVEVAERAVRQKLGEVAAERLRAMAPEHRALSALAALERLASGSSIEEVTDWLAITLRQQRWAMERANKQISDGRSEGGRVSSQKQRMRWQPWIDFACKRAGVTDAADVPSRIRWEIIDLISYLSGEESKKPAIADVAPRLPTLKGRGGKGPSIDTIQRRIFGDRRK
jgi:hypothetical protein